MKEMNEKLKKVFESKQFTKSVTIVGIVLAIILIFSAGVVTGFNKASFGRDWGDHYNDNFGIGHRGGPMGNMKKMGMDFFPNAHGVIGTIIKIELPNFIVQDRDGTEKVIITNDKTGIEKVRNFIKAQDLQIDDFVVIVGAPNTTGQIEAKFIRVVPSPDSLNTNKNTDAQ